MRVLACTYTGRSAPPNALIATSTAMFATSRWTRSAFSRPFAREIAHNAARIPGRTVTSIFFGGGTPSLMKPETVGAILDAIGGAWSVEPDAEITLEANPTSVEAERFRGYRAAGDQPRVARRAGAQRSDLRRLGRMHSVDEALAAVKIAGVDLRALFVRPDLCASRPDAAGLAARAGIRDQPRGRASVALPADHRARHMVRKAPPRRQAHRA